MSEPRKRYEQLIFDQFRFRGFHGQEAFCRLEILPIADGRTVVIATELEDNPGTSITNVAEHLASHVCDQFQIDPQRLVWIEHYGYASPAGSKDPRTYDLVTFERRPPEGVVWAPAVLRSKPDGWPGYFDEPDWRVMTDADWKSLGLDPRPPVAVHKKGE